MHHAHDERVAPPDLHVCLELAPGEPSGYLHRGYATSFADVGTPCELPSCAGWIVERPIPGSALRDGMGCYPIFCCRDWAGLAEDLTSLSERLVSLTLVTDPFGHFSVEALRSWFDVVLPYKQHYVTDLTFPTGVPRSRRHERNCARALDHVQVERVLEPWRLGDEWVDLYGQLVAKHDITGTPAFSPRSLCQQLTVPGLRMFKATAAGSVVGLHLWFIQGRVAYGHLGATSARGYDVMASYALYAFAIEQLRKEVNWLELGSSAGSIDSQAGQGLRQFKAGWATGTRPTFLCGRIFQPDAYARLVRNPQRFSTSYFPAYRRGEFDSALPDGGTVPGLKE